MSPTTRPLRRALRARRDRVGRAERLTGALALGLTALGMCGVASAGGTFLSGPTVVSGWSGSATGGPPVVALPQGHSHNDYLQDVPLSDALERGFSSVEVDVWRLGNRLLVGHELLDAAVADHTLAALYLDPLRTWVREHDGTVFAAPAAKKGEPAPAPVPFTLVVDAKWGSRTTYKLLDKILAGYGDILTRFTPHGVEPGPVTVVITGNRARTVMAADPDRWAAYDGRAAELDGSEDVPVADMPMVSEKWTRHFRWEGVGEMPAAERAELRALVAATHAQGRRLRLYDTPAPTAEARAAVWREELDAGVDLLNVDNLDAGQRFLLAYEKPAPGP